MKNLKINKKVIILKYFIFIIMIDRQIYQKLMSPTHRMMYPTFRQRTLEWI